MRAPRWLRPWRGIREAKRHLAVSERARAESARVTADIRKMREENHITSRVHAAMRGGRG